MSSILKYYAPESDIRVKSFVHLNFSSASIIQFQEFRYIIGLNRISVSKVMAIWICLALGCLILSISIYYASESDLWVKVMTIWISQELLLFNFERLDILLAWIGHPRQRLWPFRFPLHFHVKFQASQNIMHLNRTFVLKVMTIWIFFNSLFFILFSMYPSIVLWFGIV